MRELSLHILDLAHNSLAAGAKLITIVINENDDGFFVVRISDDGRGMSPELLAKVRDPFTTTRSTRKIGMGIPFIEMTTQQCGGHLEISSREGAGTELAAYFRADNIDRPPLGDLAGSIQALLTGLNSADLLLLYRRGSKEFRFDTRELRRELGEFCNFAAADLSCWLGDYLRQEIAKIQSEGEIL